MGNGLAAATAARLAAAAIVVVAWVAVAPAGTLAGAAVEVATCMGEPATIVGEPNIDLFGTSAADVIVGGPGTQRIYPRGGRDLVCGGDGHDGVFDFDHALDQIRLGARTDLFTSENADARAVVIAGDADELLDESLFYDGAGVSVNLAAGTDSRGNHLRGFGTVHGTTHADVILGARTSETIVGEGGPDMIRGRGGDDYMTTALHADCGPPQSLARLYGGAGNDIVGNSGACRSRLSGGNGGDTIGSHLGDDLLLGDAGDDYLAAGRGTDRLRGGRGGDLLRVDRGTILVSGGAGIDRWINWRQVSSNTHHTVVDIVAGTFVDSVLTRDGTKIVTTGRIAGIERFRGRSSQERFIGSSGADRINTGGTRGSQIDTIRGRGGDDRLIAPRHGRINGGAGHDYCRAETRVNCEA